MDGMTETLANLNLTQMTDGEMRGTDGGLIIVVCAKTDTASPVLFRSASTDFSDVVPIWS